MELLLFEHSETQMNEDLMLKRGMLESVHQLNGAPRATRTAADGAQRL